MKAQRPPRLSLDLLRGFHAAARHLSFTHAARELCITQSAVSQEVKALEEQLGTPLFTRVNRTLRLTQAGQQMYRAANEALVLIDSTAEEVIGAGRALSITATVPFASLWLGPRLSGFTSLHPKISLRVIASNDNLDLARERIDVAIRCLWDDSTRSLKDRLCDYEIFPVCSPALLQSAPIRTTADLAQHVLLDFETVRNGRPWYDWQLWLEAMGVRGLKPAGSLRFTHYDQVIEAALAGSGVAIGRWPHLATYLRSGILFAPLRQAGETRLGRFHLITSGAPLESTVAFVNWLRAEMDEDIAKRGSSRGAGRHAPPARRKQAILREKERR